MGGTFSSQYGRNAAWRKDPAAERTREQEAERKAADYKARVVGRRVVVTSDLAFGREREITDLVDVMFAVRLDGASGPSPDG